MKTTLAHLLAGIRQHLHYKLLHLFPLLLLFPLIQSQAQQKEWDRTYGGNSSDGLQQILQTSDGGYIAGGFSNSGPGGDKTELNRGNAGFESDFWIIKLDAAGDKQWDRTFGGAGEDWLNVIRQTADGGYILGGYSTSGATGDKKQDSGGGADYWVVKLNADGSKAWDRRFGGSARDELHSIDLTSDGGYILGGYSESGVSGDKTEASRGLSDYWVIKIDAAGNKVWDKAFGGSGRDILTSIEQTNDNGYILGGYSDSGISGEKSQASRGGYDYWVVKLNAAGTKVWDRTFGGDRADLLNDLEQTSDNGFILGGTSSSGSSGEKSEPSRGSDDEGLEDYWVIKLDASGNKVWDRTLGGNDWDTLRDLEQTSDGGYIVGGSSQSGVSGEKTQAIGDIDFWIVKLAPDGTKEWDRAIGGGDVDLLQSLQQTADEGFILGGFSESGISGDKTEAPRGLTDFWIVKLSAEGVAPCAPPTPAITVVPDPDSFIGGDPNIIILGQGHQSVTLQANGSDSYTWSPATGLSSTTVAAPVFAPTAAGIYTFTVTGRTGNCSAKATVTIVVIQPGAAGNIEWDKTFGGERDDHLQALAKTADGGYILGGRSNSGVSGDKTALNKGNFDYWVVKIDAAGNKVWDKTFGGDGYEELRDLQQTADGGYILGGFSDSGVSGDKTEPNRGPGYSDFWIVKLDAAGNKVWDKTLGGEYFDHLSALQQTPDGGYIAGGSSGSGANGDKTEPSRGFGDYWVVKLDANGNKIWDRTFGGSSDDNLSSLDWTTDGGYILGGSSWSDVSGEKTESPRGTLGGQLDFWVVKIDGNGTKQWDRTFGGDGADILHDLQQTADGGYILGGESQSNVSGDKTEPKRGYPDNRFLSDYWVVKISATGQKQWDKTIGGNMEDALMSLHQTSDKGYILGGYSDSDAGFDKSEASQGSWDYWAVKLSENGTKEWDRTYGGDKVDQLTAIEQTDDLGYILGGFSYSGISGAKSEPSRGLSDFWVIKLSGDETAPCIPPTPVITVVPTSNVFTGGDASTIYLGYGPQSVRLVATGADSYEWSPATGLSSTNVAAPVFTPTTAGSYTFTLTAYRGTCPATVSVTITVIDVRCGKGKVLLCHKGNIICVPASAVAAHLRNHATDRLGSCTINLAVKDEHTITMPLKVFPNPFGNWANVEFGLPEQGNYRLELYNANGRMLQVVAEGQVQKEQLVQMELQGGKLQEGVYYLRLITPEKVQTVRLVLKR